MTKREWAARIFRKPIESFDLINYSCRFAAETDGFFAGVEHFPHRYDLHDFLARGLAGEPIDYLEFGVWKGDTFGRWVEANRAKDSRFWGFDSFEGLPEDWEAQPQGTFSVGGQLPDIVDSRAVFVKGWFQDTLYPFLATYEARGRQVVHVDCDLYSSTLFVLSALDRHLAEGAILVFDDFSSLRHEFAAWLDYKRSFNRRFEPLALVSGGHQAAVRLIG